ncbi:MAG: DUF748 domain-containing protein [Pseudomonadota bacterium]|nr:DUF748 domain-containing protein [Pseudomonadota bacterium]
MIEMIGWMKNHKWKTLILITLSLLLIVTPYLLQGLVKQAILDYTKPYGIQQVQLEDVDFNPFQGIVSIDNLNLYQSKQPLAPATTQENAASVKPITNIGLLEVNLNVLKLLQKRIWIESIRVSDTNLPFELNEKQQLFLANIPLSSGNQSVKNIEETADDDGLGFLPGLDNVTLDNISLSITHRSKTTNLHIQNLSLSHLYAWSKDYARLEFKTKLNQAPFNANLQLHLFKEFPKVVGTLQAKSLKSSDFIHFIPKQAFDFNAVLNTDITFTLEQSSEGVKLFQQGNLDVERLAFNKKPTLADINKLSWKGDFYYTEKPIKTFDLNGKLELNSLNLNQAPYIAKLKQAALNGKVNILLDKVITISASENLNLTGLSLNDTTNQQNLLADITANLNSQLTLNNQTIKLKHQGDLAVKNLQGEYQNLLAKLEQFNWEGDVNLTSDEKVTFDSKGNMALKQLELTNNKVTLVNAETASIKELKLINTDSISVSDFSLQQFSLAKNSNLPGLLTLQKLSLDKANYNKEAEKAFIDLGQLVIQGSETHITLNKDGQIKQINTLLSALPNSQEQTASETTAKTEASSKLSKTQESDNLHYKITSLKVIGNNPIHLVNEQVQPALKKTLKLDQLTLGKVASNKPVDNTAFNLKVIFDEFSHLSSKGSFTPLQPTKAFNAVTQLDGLSLLELSPLTEQTVGYHIKSGQLSAKLETTIKDNQIDAQNKLHLNKLELESLNNEKSKELQKSFPIPLETGLAMLQDKNDNIDLSLPIKGDLNSPNFHIQDVITIALGKALAGATRSYLLLALQPFGAIALVGEYALDKASAITLQSVDFDYGKDTLSPKMQSYLGKIKVLLSERKAIQIKLCGGVNEADRRALQQAAIKSAIEKQAKHNTNSDKATQDGKKIVVPDITISNSQLLKLAAERQKVIKRYLLKLGATSKQIVICKPQISKEAKAGQVKLTI